jgi:hypothetical protein
VIEESRRSTQYGRTEVHDDMARARTIVAIISRKSFVKTGTPTQSIALSNVLIDLRITSLTILILQRGVEYAENFETLKL